MKFKCAEAGKLDNDVYNFNDTEKIVSLCQNTIESVRGIFSDLRDDATDHEIGDSFMQVAIGMAKSGPASLEALGDDNLKDLAEVFECSVESLKTMDPDKFCDKCEKQLIKDGATDSNEFLVIEAAIAAAAVTAVVSTVILSAAVAISEGANVDVKLAINELKSSLKDKSKLKDAVENITFNTYTAKQMNSQVAACMKVLDFLGKENIKTVFSEDYKLKNIEKLAATLWAVPEAWDISTIGTRVSYWMDKSPERSVGKTLKELGYSVESLQSTFGGVKALCEKFLVVAKECAKATKEASKGKEGGVISNIVAFFTKTKEEREARAIAIRDVKAKQVALKGLARGVKLLCTYMSFDLITMATKIHALAKKEQAAAQK